MNSLETIETLKRSFEGKKDKILFMMEWGKVLKRECTGGLALECLRFFLGLLDPDVSAAAGTFKRDDRVEAVAWGWGECIDPFKPTGSLIVLCLPFFSFEGVVAAGLTTLREAGRGDGGGDS